MDTLSLGSEEGEEGFTGVKVWLLLRRLLLILLLLICLLLFLLLLTMPVTSTLLPRVTPPHLTLVCQILIRYTPEY